MPHELSWGEVEALNVAMDSLFYQPGVGIPEIVATAEKMLKLVENNFGAGLTLEMLGGLHLAAMSLGYAHLRGEPSFRALAKKKENELRKKEPADSAYMKHVEGTWQPALLVSNCPGEALVKPRGRKRKPIFAHVSQTPIAERCPFCNGPAYLIRQDDAKKLAEAMRAEGIEDACPALKECDDKVRRDEMNFGACGKNIQRIVP